MISTAVKKYLNNFSIRNNLIIPSRKTFEEMNMTRQEYIFYKWSYHRKLRNNEQNNNINLSDKKT